MTARLSTLLLALVCTFPAFSQGPFKLTNLNASQLPKMVKYQGKLRNAVQWTDRSGDHIVVTAETGVYRNPKNTEDWADAELFAQHYLVKAGVAQQTWKVYDFIKDCPVDVQASFIKNTLQVTDLNKDGMGEVWVMYKTACQGDVSPATMKIIMYQRAQKFAMRGENKIKLSEQEQYGGQYTFDRTFLDGPKEFRDFALKLWNKNIMQTWEE